MKPSYGNTNVRKTLPLKKSTMEKQIKALSHGLAEVTTREHVIPKLTKHIVQYIHQSVKDFFLEEGLTTLSNSTEMATVQMADTRLAWICIRYLATEDFDKIQDYFPEEFPSLSYAADSWILHAKRCDTAGGDNLELFD